MYIKKDPKHGINEKRFLHISRVTIPKDGWLGLYPSSRRNTRADSRLKNYPTYNGRRCGGIHRKRRMKPTMISSRFLSSYLSIHRFAGTSDYSQFYPGLLTRQYLINWMNFLPEDHVHKLKIVGRRIFGRTPSPCDPPASVAEVDEPQQADIPRLTQTPSVEPVPDIESEHPDPGSLESEKSIPRPHTSPSQPEIQSQGSEATLETGNRDASPINEDITMTELPSHQVTSPIVEQRDTVPESSPTELPLNSDSRESIASKKASLKPETGVEDAELTGPAPPRDLSSEENMHHGMTPAGSSPSQKDDSRKSRELPMDVDDSLRKTDDELGEIEPSYQADRDTEFGEDPKTEAVDVREPPVPEGDAVIDDSSKDAHESSAPGDAASGVSEEEPSPTEQVAQVTEAISDIADEPPAPEDAQIEGVVQETEVIHDGDDIPHESPAPKDAQIEGVVQETEVIHDEDDIPHESPVQSTEPLASAQYSTDSSLIKEENNTPESRRKTTEGEEKQKQSEDQTPEKTMEVGLIKQSSSENQSMEEFPVSGDSKQPSQSPTSIPKTEPKTQVSVLEKSAVKVSNPVDISAFVGMPTSGKRKKTAPSTKPRVKKTINRAPDHEVAIQGSQMIGSCDTTALGDQSTTTYIPYPSLSKKRVLKPLRPSVTKRKVTGESSDASDWSLGQADLGGSTRESLRQSRVSDPTGIELPPVTSEPLVSQSPTKIRSVSNSETVTPMALTTAVAAESPKDEPMVVADVTSTVREASEVSEPSRASVGHRTTPLGTSYTAVIQNIPTSGAHTPKQSALDLFNRIPLAFPQRPRKRSSLPAILPPIDPPITLPRRARAGSVGTVRQRKSTISTKKSITFRPSNTEASTTGFDIRLGAWKKPEQVQGESSPTKMDVQPDKEAEMDKRQREAATRLKAMMKPENLNPVKRAWIKAKDTITGILHPEKKALKSWPASEDLCMTMWSYKQVKKEEVPVPELMAILLSGHAGRIVDRVYGEIKREPDLIEEMRTAVRSIYEVLPYVNTALGLTKLLGMRPGDQLMLQHLKHGQKEAQYKKSMNMALLDACTKGEMSAFLSTDQIQKITQKMAFVCSSIVAEIYGVGTPKPTGDYATVPFGAVMIGLVKGALRGTDLSKRGALSRLIAAAGGDLKALANLIAAFGGGALGLAKLLAAGGDPAKALSELLRSLNDDPLEALKALAATMGGGAKGLAAILDALGGDRDAAFRTLLEQAGGGAAGLKNLIEVAGGGAQGIRNLLAALYGEGELDDEKLVAGLANLIGAAGGLANLIESAGGDAEGIRNLIEAAGGGAQGLKNLLAAIGGDTPGEALSNLIKAAGGGLDGLKAVLAATGGGVEGLKILLEAVGGGVEGLKNLLLAAGDNPTEALANIIAAAGGGLEGLKNLLEAVGGGAEGLKNLLQAMGDDRAEALANIIAAAGGGLEGLKNLIEAVGGGVEGLKNLLEAMGDNAEEALANLIKAAGGGEEGLRNLLEAAGGGAEGLANLLQAIGGSTKEALGHLLAAAGGGEEGLRNLINAAGKGAEGLRNLLQAAGGGLEGLRNLLGAISDDPVEAFRTLLAAAGGGLEALTNLIEAAGGGAEGLKNLLDALGGGSEGLSNLLKAMGGDNMGEAFRNLLAAAGGGAEGLANLLTALGGGVEGLKNLLASLGDEFGLAGLLDSLGGGADAIAALLAALGEGEDAVRALLEAAGGGADGLAALLKAANGDPDALKKLLEALGGGPDALAKLLAMCGDNTPEALRALLESMGGGAEGLANLMRALGFDPDDPEALKAILAALGGAEAGLACLIAAMGGGKEGVANLIAALGENGLARIIAAAGGGEEGLVALIKAAGGEGGDGLANLLAALGGGEGALAALIAAAGGGQAGLTALLNAANRTAADGDGLAAIVAAAGGGADGLAALIAAAGGGEQGLANLLAAASNGDASKHADILKRLINAGGGGAEGLQNLLKAIAGKNGDPMDGLNSLLAVLGGGADALEILLAAAGGGADALATILAAAGGGAEALQALINAAGGGADGLARLMAMAKVADGEQLANILAAAGFDAALIEAARSGDLSRLTALVAEMAEKEREARLDKRRPKDLCPEEKAWLRTRAPGPPEFVIRKRGAMAEFRRMVKLQQFIEEVSEPIPVATTPPLLIKPLLYTTRKTPHDQQQSLQHKLSKPLRQRVKLAAKSLLNILTDEVLTEREKREEDLLQYQRKHRDSIEHRKREKYMARLAELKARKDKKETEQRHAEMVEWFTQYVIERKRERDELIWLEMKDRESPGETSVKRRTQREKQEEETTEEEDREKQIEEFEELERSDSLARAEVRRSLPSGKALPERLRWLAQLMGEYFGLQRDLQITPAFVWSYFDLLRGVESRLGVSFGMKPGVDALDILEELITG